MIIENELDFEDNHDKNSITIWINQWTKCIEEPAVAVEFLLVLLLETEYDLNGASSLRHLARVGNDYARSVSEKDSENVSVGC